MLREETQWMERNNLSQKMMMTVCGNYWKMKAKRMVENTAPSNDQPDTIKGHVWMWPGGKNTLLTFATSVEELLKWYLACQWSVHFHPDTHPLSYSHQNTDFHSLFSHRFHRTLMLSTHTHTHQWSGKSMASNWATWSSEHTRMQCPAVWNETNERSAEKQMNLRLQRSEVSGSGMSRLSLIRPLFTNTPNFAVGTIPKMSRCLVQEQMLGAQNHQRWIEREGWLYNYSGRKETSVMNCGKTSGFNRLFFLFRVELLKYKATQAHWRKFFTTISK